MTKSKSSLTQSQEASIYCIKNGHANYVWYCFGYVHCGRCSQQIGDQLGGVFDTRDMIVVGHDCRTCNELKDKLSKIDKKILGRLEDNKNKSYNYEKILNGVDFNEE